MDNSARENKNQYFLAFLSLLVQKKVFRKVLNYVFIHAITYINTLITPVQLYVSMLTVSYFIHTDKTELFASWAHP